ncbi:MAG: efflux RND transporter periplasmic adaptor subunit [Deltaproteobacteria bacterium]|jgi:RND family efflux transporter MFP subunit
MAAASKRRSFTWPTVLVTVVGAGVSLFVMTRPEPPIDVEVVRVQRGAVQELVPAAAAGVVQAERRVTVRAELAGTVAAVEKRAGERVEAGAVIVRFSSDELDARVAQARANTDAAQVLVEVAVDRQAVTDRTLARSKKLKERGAISATDLERVEAEARAAKLGVDKAKSAVAQARAAERLARVLLKRATVTAPYGGVLQEVTAELGVQVAPGAPLFDLIDDTRVIVEVPVDEADIPKVTVGQTVLIRVSGRRDDPIRGKVDFIPPAMGRSASPSLEATLSARDRALYVHVVPEDPSGLRVGGAVDAEFLVRRRDDVLWIPTQVVMGRGMTRAVYRVEGERARRVTFEPGLTSWERTEILKGLEAGDVIVSSLDDKRLEDRARVAFDAPSKDAHAESTAP